MTSQFIGERCASALEGETFLVLNGDRGHKCVLFLSEKLLLSHYQEERWNLSTEDIVKI